jgi:hypothetical protein
MLTNILAILIVILCYLYFTTKQKYIELPDNQENFKNVEVFKFDNIHD